MSTEHGGAGMTAATKCALCDQPAEGFANIDDRRYCHGEQRPSCYERAPWMMTRAVGLAAPTRLKATESVSPEEYATLVAAAKLQVQSDASLLKRLRLRRVAMGLSVEKVAERMGVSPETVREFEAYWANPQLSVIRRYALAVHAFVDHWVVSEEDR